MNMNYKKEFFPTPELLLEKVFEGVDWTRIESVLEPSCGRGDMLYGSKRQPGSISEILRILTVLNWIRSFARLQKGTS